MLQRKLSIEKEIRKGKVLVIYGPRQVGKTTIIKDFLQKTKLKYKFVTGDDISISSELAKCTRLSTNNFVADNELIVIDEAQKVLNIGLALKLMVDSFPDKYFIATGSSSFDLASKTAESLTGRKNVVEMYPISQLELLKQMSSFDVINSLEQYLVYGQYPEVIMQSTYEQKEKTIRQIANSYLLKDIFTYEGIKNSNIILNILKLLALQVGSQVSTVEIARKVGIDYKTVVKYIDLLEKSFVVFPLSGFSRNLRSEVTKMNKYYFYDLGIRNSIISNFNKLQDRNDIGSIWENFLIMERIKRNSYTNFYANYYFWRTYEQKEIDFIEERNGELNGYEFKWTNKNTKPLKLWLDTYENSSYTEINRDNYLDFISDNTK